jgi:vancomycin permeability regulator SanA
MNADAGPPEIPAAGGPSPVAPSPPAGSLPAPSPPAGSPAGARRQRTSVASPPAAVGRNWFAAAVARGFALFFGGFTLVNVLGAFRAPAFDENLWWVDLRFAPGVVGAVFLLALAVALLLYALRPRMPAWRRWPTVGLCLVFGAVTAWNGARFYFSWRAGDIDPGVPLPLSFVFCGVFLFVAWAALRSPAQRRRRRAAVAVLVVTTTLCVLVFPIAQVLFFGMTDYRRPGDVVVVFGAQVHDDGRPSTSLRDRMDTAVELYEAGLVKRVFVSGGVGESGYNEALVMNEMAIDAGVPAEDVVVDSNGVSTDATVTDTIPFFGDEGWRRILAVSQFYHLPRIKLAYQRAGWDVLTVPAGTSAPIPQTPRLVAREIPAFWFYYLKAVFG